MPGEQGDGIEWYKVNWSHTMGGFSKPRRSVTPEGTSTWWINVWAVVSREVILSIKSLDIHLCLIK